MMPGSSLMLDRSSQRSMTVAAESLIPVPPGLYVRRICLACYLLERHPEHVGDRSCWRRRYWRRTPRPGARPKERSASRTAPPFLRACTQCPRTSRRRLPRRGLAHGKAQVVREDDAAPYPAVPLTFSATRKSFTLVPVGPVTSSAPPASSAG